MQATSGRIEEQWSFRRGQKEPRKQGDMLCGTPAEAPMTADKGDVDFIDSTFKMISGDLFDKLSGQVRPSCWPPCDRSSSNEYALSTINLRRQLPADAVDAQHLLLFTAAHLLLLLPLE